MKSPLAKFLRSGAFLLSLALLASASRADDESEGTTITRLKFSDPAKPGIFKASLPWADVHITGTEGDEIVVTSTLTEKGKGEVRPDGLRRLDEEVSFEILEKNNVAKLEIVGGNPWASRGAEFKITVPRHTALVLHTEAGGDLKVENVEGDIEISSMNGEVTLLDIGSSAVVNTMNGEINATFKTAPVKPVSLSSMNGEISVRLPSDTKANLRMRSHNGAILTDFSDSILKAKSENRVRSEGTTTVVVAEPAETVDVEIAKEAAEMDREAAKIAREAAETMRHAVHSPHAPIPPVPPVPPAFGGKSVIGTLNGGGVDIQLATMNGSITLRQAK
jgi:hypothetical protein